MIFSRGGKRPASLRDSDPQLAQAMEIPLYQLFYEGEEPRRSQNNRLTRAVARPVGRALVDHELATPFLECFQIGIRCVDGRQFDRSGVVS
jgi:hypothetical protein